MPVTINLLPPEMRPKQRPSMGEMLPWLGAAAVVLLAAGGFGYLYFVEQAKAQDERDRLQATLDGLKPKVTYADALEKEERDYKKRVDTIGEIASSRTLWSRNLDRMTDVIESSGDQSYLVWLNGLDVKPAKPAARGRGRPKRGEAKPGDSIAMDLVCFAKSEGVQALAAFNDFHAALKGSPLFAQDGLKMSAPAGQAQDFEDGELLPRNGWQAKVTMSMRAPVPQKPRRVRAN